jgi:S-DNA-T family DNA segregation ATPase FtsK/SpoIIIE
MAKSKSTKKKKATQPTEKFWHKPYFKSSVGILFFFLFTFSTIASVSFLLNWKSDQSLLALSFSDFFLNPDVHVKNVFGKLGAAFGYQWVYKWFGVSAFLFSYLFLIFGINTFSVKYKFPVWKHLTGVLLLALWLSTAMGLFSTGKTILSGGLGFFLATWLNGWMGFAGTLLLLVFSILVTLIVRFKMSPESITQFFARFKPTKKSTESDSSSDETSAVEDSPAESESEPEILIDETEEVESEMELKTEPEEEYTEQELSPVEEKSEMVIEKSSEEDVEMAVETAKEEEIDEDEQKSKKLVDEFGQYDPRLDLAKFQFPTIDLLKDYGAGNIEINQEELEENKNKIVTTLKNYNIEIAKIKATVGPTITLYEIVPEAGIRISKIKNLEDDIALSLSALGIRIIAPIPGKGTIGIEVPNTKKNIVSMRSVIASKKFQQADMELPIAMGKTISNETFVVDLAKMPHLLMAGATGQGKSVGLNAILTSLLYTKHPAEVKFVLVDPKKVELTLFNKIERHYLAKLPDTDEAIITDTKKVINTLNSLCIEMDERYELLKTAMCRNIIEYNKKFVDRKLNPENGHKYLPYIVLVIDEFADLIMTAGKEVETPIARLAQLARAIGIHLIVATQRPSVNVITGIIKANFPARVAFRVTSKIDSRTILDAGGADQLIGKGDMLFASGSAMTRIQCAFVDTPEVEEITDFIGNQRAYPEAFQLPEYVGEDGGGGGLEDNPDERDSKFEEAARIIVQHQQGSASLLQRKLKLGYNRAGRIIDQLEAAGVVGPFEGSKARQVLVPDENALEQLLNGDN